MSHMTKNYRSGRWRNCLYTIRKHGGLSKPDAESAIGTLTAVALVAHASDVRHFNNDKTAQKFKCVCLGSRTPCSKVVQENRCVPVPCRSAVNVQPEPGFQFVLQPEGLLFARQQVAFKGHACLPGKPAMGGILPAQFVLPDRAV